MLNPPCAHSQTHPFDATTFQGSVWLSRYGHSYVAVKRFEAFKGASSLTLVGLKMQHSSQPFNLNPAPLFRI